MPSAITIKKLKKTLLTQELEITWHLGHTVSEVTGKAKESERACNWGSAFHWGSG